MIQVLPFLNNPKDLDPSYKMDQDFCDCPISEEIWYMYNFVHNYDSRLDSQLLLIYLIGITSYK